jgi:hypothetical protein
MKIALLAATIGLAGIAVGQTSTPLPSKASHKGHTSAKHNVASGAGDIGKGAGKGVGSAAVGTAKAAGNLATLHPIDAASSLGKGAAGAGKDVGVGAVRGTGKILKGTGQAIRHIL